MTIPDPAAEFFVHPTAVVDEGAAIGPGTKIWHFCHIMPGAELGPGCNLGQNVMIASGVKLGRNVKIQNNVSVYTGVVCEDDVFLGPSCVFTNVRNPRSAVPRRSQYLATVVRRGATVGANATIVCGTEIGEYAFVGAGAVVTKPVPPYASRSCARASTPRDFCPARRSRGATSCSRTTKAACRKPRSTS